MAKIPRFARRENAQVAALELLLQCRSENGCEMREEFERRHCPVIFRTISVASSRDGYSSTS